MCVIVDANRASSFFAEPPGAEDAPVVDWILGKGGRLVFGGKLSEELLRINASVRTLRQWTLSGRALEIPAPLVSEEERLLRRMGICRSNDHHVVALARLSGARIVVTGDQALMADVGNAQLLSAPRGKVYQRPEHAKLLKHSSSCGLAGTRIRSRRAP